MIEAITICCQKRSLRVPKEEPHHSYKQHIQGPGQWTCGMVQLWLLGFSEHLLGPRLSYSDGYHGEVYMCGPDNWVGRGYAWRLTMQSNWPAIFDQVLLMDQWLRQRHMQRFGQQTVFGWFAVSADEACIYYRNPARAEFHST